MNDRSNSSTVSKVSFGAGARWHVWKAKHLEGGPRLGSHSTKMIFSLCGLCLENLPVGALRRTTIDAARAKALVQEAAVADRLIGIADFGAAPDPEEEKRFGQLLDVLKTVHDIDLDRKAFFSAIDDEDDPASGPAWFANAITLYQANPEQPLLVVTYYLTPGQQEFFDMDVSPDSLTFDLVEVVQ